MMMRRVQTAAGVSGGGEGASDLLDDSDASDVIFVSCNASAILATRLKVLLSDLPVPSNVRSQAGFKGQLRVYATSNGLLAGLIATNIAMYQLKYIYMCTELLGRTMAPQMLANSSSFKWIEGPKTQHRITSHYLRTNSRR